MGTSSMRRSASQAGVIDAASTLGGPASSRPLGMVAAPSAAPGAEAATPGPPEGHDSTRPSLLGVGVVVWLSSELMFFAGLFAAYFTLRSEADLWPPADVHLATGRTAVATAV